MSPSCFYQTILVLYFSIDPTSVFAGHKALLHPPYDGMSLSAKHSDLHIHMLAQRNT